MTAQSRPDGYVVDFPSVRESDLREGSPRANPDDYLSDLAGKEIDRLLEGDELRRPDSSARQSSPSSRHAAPSLVADVVADINVTLPTLEAQPAEPPAAAQTQDSAAINAAVFSPAANTLDPAAQEASQVAISEQPSVHDATKSDLGAAVDGSVDALESLPEHAAISAATLGPESAVQATIDRELDQVFEQQVAGTVQDRPPLDAAALPAAPLGVSVEAPAGSPEHAAHSAAADTVSPDGVSDLLNRLTAGERPAAPAGEAAEAGSSFPGHAGDEHASEDAEKLPHVAIPVDDATGVSIPSVDATGTHADSAENAAPEVDMQSVVMAPPAARSATAAKLLDFIAFLLDPFSDEAREAVGKIAIITAVNALAVLIYVMFFRG